MKKINIRQYYIILLIIGLGAEVLTKLFLSFWGTGLLTLIWIYAFLELVSRFHTKKELIVTGTFFIAGYFFRFTGATGNFLLELALFVTLGLVQYAAFFISAYFMRRWNNLRSTFIFPIFWTLEYCVATFLRFPSLFRIDMLFSDMNILMHLERLIGSFGFTFLIIWIISLVRYSVSNHKHRYAGLAAGLFLAMFIPGIIYLYPNIMAPQYFRAAYTTGPYIGDFLTTKSSTYEYDAKCLETSILDAASQDAAILVFNEQAFDLDSSDEERFIQLCSTLARENSIAVLIGLDVRDSKENSDGISINKLVLIGDDGEVLNSYQKSRLIPFLEDKYAKGDEIIPSTQLKLKNKEIKISYLICYDSNFPEHVKHMDADTDILFLPSWDWSPITQLHARLCKSIAIENNVYVLKPTYDGISIAVNPDGKIFHKSSTEETGFENVQIVDIPIKSSAFKIERLNKIKVLDYAISWIDIFSMLICLVLLMGTVTFNNVKSLRSHVFSTMLITNIVACLADAFSWLLDGHIRLESLLYWTTVLSFLFTFILIWQFVAYFFEYIRERIDVSSVPLYIFSFFSVAAVIAIFFMCLNGSIFRMVNGVYFTGPYYNIYLIINAVALLSSLIIIAAYRKSFTYTDKVVVFVYMIIPLTAAVINMLFDDCSFAYPATTLSILMIYAMIQNDKVDRLEHEGEIADYKVMHDELTGLFNRRAYEHRRSILKETNGNSGIIFGDLNGLKYANDNFGHEAGDKQLIRFAGILADIFRANEIFRISGDEFICIMENVDEETFYRRLSELEEKINQDEQPMASFGAAIGPNREIDILINTAEANMYIEKKAFHERFPKTSR